MNNDEKPRAFISYVHGQYDQELVRLSDKLRAHGVDCEIDAYEEAPAKGWLQWMEDMVMSSRTVLVVCTVGYARRLRGEARPGVGLGSAWEGRFVKLRVYDDQGRNEGIVPIVMTRDDLEFVPPFLQDVTYYYLGQKDGFERLYRRLTRQPAHPRPPLGEIVEMPPVSAESDVYYQHWALFDLPNGSRIPAEVEQFSRERGRVTVQLRASMGDARALVGLTDAHGRRLAFSYRFDCYAGPIRDVRHTVDAGRDIIVISIDASPLPAAGRITDMSYNGVSADDIAMMRARRILLNEPLPELCRKDSTMDSFVAGAIGGEGVVEVRRSNLPEINEHVRGDAEFAAIARLDSILQLVLSGTVAQIERLEIRRNDGIVTVDFVGIRGRVYDNREPTRFEIHEACMV